MQPLLFEIPILGLPVHGFGFMMVVGFLLGLYLARRRALDAGVDPDVVSTLSILCLVGGIVGCRLFYVVHNWQQFADTFAGQGFWAGVFRLVDIRSGGLEFFGGLVLTTVGMVAYIVWWRLPLGTVLDILAPSLAIGHGLGKVGCFLNGCCYGVACPPDFPTAARFPKFERVEAVAPGPPAEALPAGVGAGPLGTGTGEGVLRPVASEPVLDHLRRGWLRHEPHVPQRSLPVHPTQVYEAFGELLLAGLLTVYFPLRRRAGQVAALYFLLYMPTRFVLEFTRSEPKELFGGTLSVHQGISLTLLMAAALVWVWLSRRGTPVGEPPALLPQPAA